MRSPLLIFAVIATTVLASPLRRDATDFCPAMNLQGVPFSTSITEIQGAVSVVECFYGQDICTYDALNPPGATEANGCPVVNILNAPVFPNSTVTGTGLDEILNVRDAPTGVANIIFGDSSCPTCLPNNQACLENPVLNHAHYSSLRNNRRGRRPPAPGSNLARLPRKLDHSNGTK
ncbi:hypothetical protein DFH06DRAFT_1128689 [Mycena polygramma]|nr:hypothetical protein DFH06DRAFT_1128689 [Mycena polygramma]